MTDKKKKDREQKKKRGHRHLTPLEIITIAEAFERGEKVASLATQFGVSRQTIYNAIKAIKERRVSKEGSIAKITSNKRKRTTRIPEETCTELINLKKKYPKSKGKVGKHNKLISFLIYLLQNKIDVN